MIDSYSLQSSPKPVVYMVGLSSKPNIEPLSSDTKTGEIVDQICNMLPHISIVKTNLVRKAPLDEFGKLRYPYPAEMKQGWKILRGEIDVISPSLLVLLGQQVSYFLRCEMQIQPIKPHLPSDFEYLDYCFQRSPSMLSVHHPSYIYVYRRKYIKDYVENVAKAISFLLGHTMTQQRYIDSYVQKVYLA